MKTLLSTIIFFYFIFKGYSQTIELQIFGPSFTNPVEIANAGDNRLFIVEKAGIIKILNARRNSKPNTFFKYNEFSWLWWRTRFIRD